MFDVSQGKTYQRLVSLQDKGGGEPRHGGQRPCEDGWTLHLAVTSCGPPGANRSWKRQGRISPRAFGGSVALRTPWFRDSGLRNYERTDVCCVESSSWRQFVSVATGQQHTCGQGDKHSLSRAVRAPTGRAWKVLCTGHSRRGLPWAPGAALPRVGPWGSVTGLECEESHRGQTGQMTRG